MVRWTFVVALACAAPRLGAQPVDEIDVLKARLRALEARVSVLEAPRQDVRRPENELSHTWYRQELISIGPNPGPIPSTERPVRDDSQLRIGQVLQVKWSSSWWAARVTQLLPDGRVRIRYLGWDPRWDVVVSRELLQFDDDAEAKAKRAVDRRKPAAGQAERPPAKPRDSVGIALTAKTPIGPGLAVEVLWGGQWWAAKVLDVKNNGDVSITYLGWDSRWDEVVPRTRLRLPANSGGSM